MYFETEFRYCIMKQIFTVCHQQTARKAYVLTYTLLCLILGGSQIIKLQFLR